MTGVEEHLPLGEQAVHYEFMVPVYHDVVGEVSLESVSFFGAILLILLVAVVLFKFKLSTPKKHKEE